MTTQPPKLPTMFEQLLASAAHAAKHPDQPRQWPMNPFPRGVRPGSATEKIMVALNAAHPRWFEHWELMRICGRSRGAVSWAMAYLQLHGKARSIQSGRNPQYRRYQAITIKGNDHE